MLLLGSRGVELIGGTYVLFCLEAHPWMSEPTKNRWSDKLEKNCFTLPNRLEKPHPFVCHLVPGI